jgi:hypothetical protein
VSIVDGSVLRRYPPLSSYRPPVGMQQLRHPGRWRLGEADSTGATHRPARQLVSTLADGRRLVEKAHTTHTYFSAGALQSIERHRLLGGVLSRDYYPGGARKAVLAEGWLGSYSRAWDQSGHLTQRDYDSPLGAHPARKLRNYLKRAHPLRTLKRKLRRFHPMQPVYRAFHKVFPRNDHHTPPHKD